MRVRRLSLCCCFFLIMTVARSQIRELFETLDRDANGILSPAEVETFSSSAIGADGQPLDAVGRQQHFANIDSDQNGSIDYSEFELAASSGAGSGSTAPTDFEASSQAIMSHFDADLNGKLSGSELDGLLAASHGLSAEMLDADADGSVTQQELARAMKSMIGGSASGS